MYSREKDRVRTILAGTPLSAESIRLSEQELGSHWHGTSWFFFMHLIAKTFTNTETIDFHTLQSTVNDYGITRWTDPSILKYELNLLTKVFKYRDLGNVHLDNKGLNIDGKISDPELRRYADSQYDYAMGEGLVRYSKGYRAHMARNMSNFAERIWWDYMTKIYDGPKIYSGPNDENHLDAIFQDMTEEMSGKKLSYRGIDIWTDDQLEHCLPLLKGWERDLVTKNILRSFDFGEFTFIAPRYFPNIDKRSIYSGKFKGEDHSSLLNLIESVGKLPSYPVFKGDKVRYQLCRSLERAGAVVIVPEVKGGSIPLYVYLVSRDVFEEMDTKISYKYSKSPVTEFGDISITDEVFRALGRARLFGQKILPGTELTGINYEHEIDKIFDNLTTRGNSPLGEYQPIFNPLQILNVIDIENGEASIASENMFILKQLSDYWNELINDPIMARVELPKKIIVKRSEEGQVLNQVKKGASTQIFGV